MLKGCVNRIFVTDDKDEKGVKTMTNGDVIRNMTDEEIADFLLSEDANACSHCEYYDHETQRCYLDNPCVTELSRVMLLEWLSSQTVSERSEKEGAENKVPQRGI